MSSTILRDVISSTEQMKAEPGSTGCVLVAEDLVTIINKMYLPRLLLSRELNKIILLFILLPPPKKGALEQKLLHSLI